MTFPAWFDLMRDPIITRKPVAMRVYAQLVSDQRAFYAPQECKQWALAAALGVKDDSVGMALTALVEGGYLIEHPRQSVLCPRVFTIALERRCPPNRDSSAA